MYTTKIILGVLAGATGAAGAIVVCNLWRRPGVIRKKYIRDRIYTSDEEFVRLLNTDVEHHKLCLIIRDTIAEWCGVPKNMLHPKDDTHILAEMMERGIDSGWDEMTFLEQLGDRMGVLLAGGPQVPPIIEVKSLLSPQQAGPQCFGDWVTSTARLIKTFLSTIEGGEAKR
jgi:hypothetical protein